MPLGKVKAGRMRSRPKIESSADASWDRHVPKLAPRSSGVKTGKGNLPTKYAAVAAGPAYRVAEYLDEGRSSPVRLP